MSWSDFFDRSVVEIIIEALGAAYQANSLSYDPEIGNSPTSYGVSVWQSSLHFLEQGFGSVLEAEIHRNGSAFHVKLPTSRISFYKFSTKTRAEDFRLDGSRKRELIVENNQMSLFNYQMDGKAQPVSLPEIVVLHSGTPEGGLLAVHIGAPISSERAQDGWLWLEQVYMKDEQGEDTPRVDTPPPTPTTPSFDEMPEPSFDVEVRPNEEERPDTGNA